MAGKETFGIVLTFLLIVAAWAPLASGRAASPDGDHDCERHGAGFVGRAREIVDAHRPTARLVIETICIGEDATTGSAPVPGDGCASTAYALASHKWSTPYSAKIDPRGSAIPQDALVAAMNAGGLVWDDAAAADVFGSIAPGGEGSRAGTRDGVNQIAFRSLGTTGVLARTYSWYSSTGRALESDAVYNTAYAWSTTGASSATDLQSVAAHELGHAVGMGHAATGSANACLTMYPSIVRGTTHARTLGLGDVLGIQALYGAASAPAPAPAPAPTPTPTLNATFTPHAANNWWVEVRVGADQPLAGVSASVNGGAPVALTYRTWGTWAQSFYVPTGAVVRFTATGANGASATSSGYSWPSMTPT